MITRINGLETDMYLQLLSIAAENERVIYMFDSMKSGREAI